MNRVFALCQLLKFGMWLDRLCLFWKGRIRRIAWFSRRPFSYTGESVVEEKVCGDEQVDRLLITVMATESTITKV